MRQSESVEKARLMRSSGLSVTKIGQLLNIDSTRVSRWVNNIEKSQEDFPGKRGIITLQRKERIKSFNKDKVGSISLKKAEARLLVSIFYWCEGSKYPASSNVNFTSSDMEMQKLFVFLFRKAFAPAEEKFRILLQLHSTHDIKKTSNIWSQALQIPVRQFYNPHITEKKGGKYRENYLGTCSVRYYDYRLQLRMMGLYTRFSRKIFTVNNLI